jgi:hypothetical protein
MIARRLDQLSLLGMLAGIAIMLLPIAGALRVGFFVALLFTLVQIVVGRLAAGKAER